MRWIKIPYHLTVIKLKLIQCAYKHLSTSKKESLHMPLSTIVLIILILFFIGALPSWPHSKSWGYWPSGGLGTVLIIVLILMLMERI
jgi:hypothetical protein